MARDGERLKREVAWRMFADEFNQSTVSLGDEGEGSPQYVLSPLGARVNRLYFVGVLTERSNRGSEEEPVIRAKIVDPTGTFFVTAGQYQREAMLELQAAEIPSVLAVVGKSRTYSPEGETVYTSVRPESVAVVDQEVQMEWLLQACRDTLARIDAVKEARGMAGATPQMLESLGCRANLAIGVPMALERYPNFDLERSATIVADILASLSQGTVASKLSVEPASRSGGRGDGGAYDDEHAGGDGVSFDGSSIDAAMDSPAPANEGAGPAQPPKPATAASAKANDQAEQDILALLGCLEQTSRGVPYQKLLAAATAKGMTKTAVEECVNVLIDKGLVYEPTLGYLKAV